MSTRYRNEKEAKAAAKFLRFLLGERKSGFRIPKRRDKKAQDFVLGCELQRMLDERGRMPDPPRALRVENGYWIVYRDRHGGPVLTVGTEQDETVARAVINRIEAEGDTILTGRGCALCDTWMVPKTGTAWSKALDKDARAAMAKLLDIGVVLPFEEIVGCCSECRYEAYERIKNDLLAEYDEWRAADRMRWEKSRWYRAGRKVGGILNFNRRRRG